MGDIPVRSLITRLMVKLRSKLGQGTVEYALITLAVVGIVLLAVNGTLQKAIVGAFANVSTAIVAAAASPKP